MYHEYPYTTYFHDIDKLCKACHDAGYKLLVDANALKLLNKNDEVVSTVVIHYAETALQDVDGKAIKSYIFNASTNTDELVFTKGDGTTFSLTIPFATKAEKDKLNKDLTSYVYEVQTSGNKIQIVKGDSTVTEITVPFATKALTDTNGKDIKTYAATMTVDGDNIVLKDSTGAELARLTAPYALKAFSDDDGDTFTTTYAATLEAGTTTVILKAKDGNTLSTITVPYATKALNDTAGNAFLHDYAEKIVVDGDGKRIGLEAHDGTRLATITVPFATLATDATNAVETISVVGDQLVFTTYGGQAYSITAPYAVKAQKDDAGNTIKSTYIASVTNDVQTGKLTFKDALGQTIVELTPTVSKATYDSYNNIIADYVKTILASTSSDYVTVTHGDGDTEQITINYATHAWKDTNENVIKNTYIKRLACVEDVNDGHYKLVAYNGDNPEAELFRIELTAYMAQRAIADENGVNIAQKNLAQDNRMTNIENSIENLELTKLYNGSTLIEEASLGDHLSYDSIAKKLNVTNLFTLYSEEKVSISGSSACDTSTATYTYAPDYISTFEVGKYYQFWTFGTYINARGTVEFVDNLDSPTTHLYIDCSSINDDITNLYFKITEIGTNNYKAIGYKDLPTKEKVYNEPIKVGNLLEVENDTLNVQLPEPTDAGYNKVLRIINENDKWQYVLQPTEIVYKGSCNFDNDPNSSSDIVWDNDVDPNDILIAARSYLYGDNENIPVALSIHSTSSVDDQHQRVMLRPQYVYYNTSINEDIVHFSGIVKDFNGLVNLYTVQLTATGTTAVMQKTILAQDKS